MKLLTTAQLAAVAKPNGGVGPNAVGETSVFLGVPVAASANLSNPLLPLQISCKVHGCTDPRRWYGSITKIQKGVQFGAKKFRFLSFRDPGHLQQLIAATASYGMTIQLKLFCAPAQAAKDFALGLPVHHYLTSGQHSQPPPKQTKSDAFRFKKKEQHKNIK